jgi:hypothetical protein
MCFFFSFCAKGRQRDLGEELLGVAPDLHGSLAAYVLCRSYRLSARFRAVLVTKLVLYMTINDRGTHLVYGARHGRAAAGPPRRACARPRSISPSAWISCMACVPERHVPKVRPWLEETSPASLYLRFGN